MKRFFSRKSITNKNDNTNNNNNDSSNDIIEDIKYDIKYDDNKTETLDDIKFLNDMVNEIKISQNNNNENGFTQGLDKPNTFVGKYVIIYIYHI